MQGALPSNSSDMVVFAGCCWFLFFFSFFFFFFMRRVVLPPPPSCLHHSFVFSLSLSLLFFPLLACCSFLFQLPLSCSKQDKPILKLTKTITQTHIHKPTHRKKDHLFCHTIHSPIHSSHSELHVHQLQTRLSQQPKASPPQTPPHTAIWLLLAACCLLLVSVFTCTRMANQQNKAYYIPAPLA